ncbi:MAG: CocE/NonD family hydrolase [Hyphomonadaceae bacterium]
MNAKTRFAVALLAGASALAAACTPPASAPSEPPEETQQGIRLPESGRHLAHVQVPMRDGVRLDTDIWLPGEGRYPVILIRTPYESEVSGRAIFPNRLIQSGYAVVQQHERGRYFSEGQMRMLGRADEDGWDTLDWLVAQPWSNGKIGTYGCSSSAENQLKLATLKHPAHKAMIAFSSGVGIAEAGRYREQGNFWRGGAWQMGWADYFLAAMPIHWPQLAEGLSDEERQRVSGLLHLSNEGGATDEALMQARMHLPMIEFEQAAGGAKTELADYLLRGPSNPAWAEDRVTDADVSSVPGLYAEALYDISARSGVARFEMLRQANGRDTQAVMITNGQHCGYGRETQDFHVGDRPIGDARFDYDARKIAWFDRWLKDDQQAPTPARPVTVYMAGANRWASFDAVPTAQGDTARTFFLSSNGSANTADGDGVLVAAIPAETATDRFAYDPADPVIAHGGEISGVGPDQEDGSFDQREIERRPDVLVYTSEPLTEDLPVFGFIHATLQVASDAPDTDFTLKLVDVAPDGTAWNIADSILRMRYREGVEREVFMEPGKTYAISPPDMLAANVFLKGHRIRLEVSSSNFPSYARNLNTAANPYTSTALQIANNQVLHGPDAVSSIALPVVVLPEK